VRLAIQIAFILFATSAFIVGALMLFAPTRYPNLYARFLNEYVVRRETSEHGHIIATRGHGFVMMAMGLFFGLIVWALR
jgi:hypothetical protein